MMAACRDVVWAALVLFMLFCSTPTYAQTVSCRNTKAECLAMAVSGRCVQDRQHMVQFCPATCSFCTNPGCQKTGINCPWQVVCRACIARGQRAQPFCRACNRTSVNNKLFNHLKNRQTITSPNFDCGREVPTTSSNRGSGTRRIVRQIIFPDQLEELRRAAALQKEMENKTANKATEDNDVMVSVTDTFCGATPISDRFLLTAAHCVFNPDFPLNAVRLGELDFGSDKENNSAPVDYEIEEIIVHPSFNPDTHVRYNDIALLKTAQKIEFNQFVFPYCLKRERPKPKTLVTGAGFGLVNSTHQSSILQEVELEVVGTAECENIYIAEDREPHLRLLYPELMQGKDIMCASYPERSTCQGDSGGPLFLDDAEGRRFLVGIVGAGVSCRVNGISKLPGLYISVADHIDFIDSVLYSGQ